METTQTLEQIQRGAVRTYRVAAGVFLMISLSATLANSATPPHLTERDLLSNIEGWYTTKSYCSEDKRSSTPCGLVAPKTKDMDGWVAIKKIDSTRAKFLIEIGEHGGGDCIVWGIARLQQSHLVYVQRHGNNDADGRGFEIYVDGPLLKLRYLQDESSPSKTFCQPNTNANLESVVLQIGDKKPVSNCQCEVLDDNEKFGDDD